MKICVVGWYFRPEFLYSMAFAFPKGDVFVIKHRAGETCGIPSQLYPNVGLEFGAYQQYLENHWNGVSDVLFMHDDAEFAPDADDRSTAYEAMASIEHLRDMGIHQAFNMGIHQAFIFNNEWEEIGNKGKHGRAIWCSGEFLRKLKADGGFPYDRSNTGTLTGPRVNEGIEAFTRYVNEQDGAGYIAIVPGIQHGRRGELPNGAYVYHRKTREGAVLMPGAPNHCIVIGAGNGE